MDKKKEVWNKHFDKNSVSRSPSVRLNMTLEGDPALWLLEWKNRGLVTSCHDAVNQAFRVFHQKIVEQDLKAAQLKTLKKEVVC
jgi:hypothetical protein